jgi:hypothetical protein
MATHNSLIPSSDTENDLCVDQGRIDLTFLALITGLVVTADSIDKGMIWANNVSDEYISSILHFIAIFMLIRLCI